MGLMPVADEVTVPAPNADSTASSRFKTVLSSECRENLMIWVMTSNQMSVRPAFTGASART
jgi:hypothetical protein